ncbi:amidohydrolase [Belnapia sp. F-4-1]|uniref:amidohydrolase n=1 Tax=Belnapia sp. F-4-1 TaxID=1545443 RepID=UPI0009DFAA5B|nr:amidohydrolase [Belnapia sp. F-4-1]
MPGMDPVDTLLTEARLPDGRTGMAVACAGGRIAAILPPGAPLPPAAATHALGGQLLLPGLTDGHLHLDKTLMGLPWMPHAAGPSRASRIETDQRLMPHLPLPPAERASNLIRRCVAQGTALIRTHADITPTFGLSMLEGILEAKARHAGEVRIQTVAFPQAGVVTAPGTEALLDAALRAGADLLGGLDPCEVDRDPKGQLDILFRLAERHGVGLDIHLHEASELGLFSLAEIAARTRAHGMQGRVTISHGFCLGALAESRLEAAAAMMAEAGMALVSHGAGGAPLPPLLRLRAAGVRVFCGNDNLRDLWSPYGTGDMLERAAIIGWRLDARTDAALAEIFDIVSAAGAAVMGEEAPALAVRAPAHLFSIAAETVGEAIGAHPARAVVVFAGNLVHRGQ